MHCEAEKWFVLIIVWTWVVIRGVAMNPAKHPINIRLWCMEDCVSLDSFT